MTPVRPRDRGLRVGLREHDLKAIIFFLYFLLFKSRVTFIPTEGYQENTKTQKQEYRN